MAGTETKRSLRIGELAAQLGLNPKTIRYYESIGLLPAPARTEAGYRLYSPDDRERLIFIRKAQAVGLTLAEIGQLLQLGQAGEAPCGYLNELVEQKLADIDAQLQALHDFRRELLTLQAEASDGRCSDGYVCGIIEQHAHQLSDAVSVPILRSPRRARTSTTSEPRRTP